MQYCRRGRKCGDLCPAPSQSYVWISLLNVDSLFGMSINSTAATTPIVILMVFSIKQLHSQLEKNRRRPLDRCHERKSLDSDSDRRYSLVPRLQNPRKAEKREWQEEENQCFCPEWKRAKEEIQTWSKGGGGAPGCHTSARCWGGTRDAERLLPAGCGPGRTVQQMGHRRPPLPIRC